jgi:hypothetical protein
MLIRIKIKTAAVAAVWPSLLPVQQFPFRAALAWTAMTARSKTPQ